jgi:hypothetical protein
VAKLIYAALTSLDGYVADETGNFGWAVPDADADTVSHEAARAFATQVVPVQVDRCARPTRCSRPTTFMIATMALC